MEELDRRGRSDLMYKKVKTQPGLDKGLGLSAGLDKVSNKNGGIKDEQGD